MAGISKAEREKRATKEAPIWEAKCGTCGQDKMPSSGCGNVWHQPYAVAHRLAHGVRTPKVVDVVTDKIPTTPPRALYASDGFYLTALCAALPFSGIAKAWEPLTFEMRLEAAKVNADLILRAVAERGGE